MQIMASSSNSSSDDRENVNKKEDWIWKRYWIKRKEFYDLIVISAKFLSLSDSLILEETIENNLTRKTYYLCVAAGIHDPGEFYVNMLDPTKLLFYLTRDLQ